MKTLITSFLFLIMSFFSIAQSALDSGLVAFYPFDGNANDESIYGNDGSLINGASFVNDRWSNPNQAIRFEKSLSQYVSVPNSTSLQIDSALTFSVWIKRNSLGGQDQVLNKGGDWPNGTCNYGLVFSEWTLCFIYNGGYYIVNSPGVPQDNDWHHYVVTALNGTSEVHFYVDGVEKAPMFGGGSPVINLYAQSTSDLYISGVNYFSDNTMDELKIYNRILSENEIKSLYSDLVMFLPFNGNADDKSGNNNNGTVSGATLTQDRFGTPGKAYYFNGTSDFISILDNPNLFSDELTISWWYKMTEILGGERVVIGWVDGGHRYQQFFSGGQLSYLNGYNLNQSGILFNPIYGLNDLNVWKNVVVTYKKLTETTSTSSIYVDGELKQTDNHNLAMDYVPGINFFIGKNHNGNFFNGYLDDFRIYNRVLNDNEILALYNDSTTYFPVLIDSVYPHQNSNYFQQHETIRVFFSQPMDSASIVSANTTWRRVYVHGSLTGKHLFDVSYSTATNSLEILPTTALKYGEFITVSLDSLILTASGNNLTPYVFQFNVKPENGSVKFAVADSFQLNFSPQNIVSGDFNNDGKVDVIVSNYDSSKYTILLNNGSGGFTLGEELAGPFKPYSISFTDIDNDRDLDMIVSTNEENKIRVLRGTGQGIFSWILPTLDVNLPIATCPGDFDGDGDNDFVALCNTGNAIFYKNDGTGNFTQAGSVTINGTSLRNIVGDIDNDGDLDIIGGSSGYWSVFQILKNDGNGNFSFISGPYLGPNPDEIAGGDFDGDYDLDFVKYDWYQNGLGIAINNGVGEFPIENFFNLGNVGGQTRNPVVNDFDGDGDLDFVGVFNNNNVGIVKNNTHPNYELALAYPIPGLRGIASADFDNNGSIDLVGISSTTNQVKFIRNISDSLVAYFPFNGNANDESVFHNNGSAINALLTTDRYANPDAAYFFNGFDSRIQVPENSLYDFGFGDFTITSWINVSEIKTARIVSAGYDANDNLWGLGFGTYPAWGNGLRINYFVYSENAYRAFSSDEIFGYNSGEWAFLAVSKSGDQIKFYQNGMLVGSENISYPSNSNSYLSIGCRQLLNNNLVAFFNGKIDEVKIFTTSFSGQEIWNMYKSTTSAPNLQSPANNSIVNTLTPLLVWDSLVTATNYSVQVATDSLFNTIVLLQFSNAASYLVESGALNPNVDYYWRVRTNNDGGIGPWSEVYNFRTLLTDVEDETQLPKQFALMQNYPNPFNPSTTITYHLPKTARVELKIYDLLGNEIATLANEEKPAGIYHIEFNLASGIRNLASGIFFYQLKAGEFVQTRKMNFIK